MLISKNTSTVSDVNREQMEGLKSNPQQSRTKFVPTFLDKEYQFDYSNIGNNGFLLQNIYLPEEILLHILSYANPKELLNYSLVCHNWNRLIRSDILWFKMYERQYNRKAKTLPWYLYYCLLSTNYFDTNLLMNENNTQHWNYCQKIGYDLPPVPELSSRQCDVFVLVIKARQVVRRDGYSRLCFKLSWSIKLGKSELFQYILDVYKPHICLTKWGSYYDLQYGLLEKDVAVVSNCHGTRVLGNMHFTKWLDLIITQYPEGTQGILLEQTCGNTKYTNRASVKLLFDSIDFNKTEKCKKFSGFEYISKKQSLEDLSED